MTQHVRAAELPAPRPGVRALLALVVLGAALLLASAAPAGQRIVVTGIVGVTDAAVFVMDDTGRIYLLPEADVMEGDRVRVTGTLVDKNGEAAIEAATVELLDETPAGASGPAAGKDADDAPAPGTTKKN